MEYLNQQIFLDINASAHPPWLALGAGLFFADWLVPLAVLLFVILWVRKSAEDRGALITATLIMLIGLGINQVLGALYFHPRPFMIGLGHQFLPHPPDNSFPSDHGTFMWSLGFALLYMGKLRRWGILLVAGGLAVAWARIYVGVHFPLDMVGSLVVALTVSIFSRRLHTQVGRWVLPFSEIIYRKTIRACHLPPVIFPRE